MADSPRPRRTRTRRPPSPADRTPAPRPCGSCNKAKSRCEGGFPCLRCFNLTLPCVPVGRLNGPLLELILGSADVKAHVGMFIRGFQRLVAAGGCSRPRVISVLRSWRFYSLLAGGKDVTHGIGDQVCKALRIRATELEDRELLALEPPGAATGIYRAHPILVKAQRCMAREARALEEAPVLEQEDIPMGALFIVQYGADGGTAMRCNSRFEREIRSAEAMNQGIITRRSLNLLTFPSMLAPDDREEWLAALAEASFQTEPAWQRTLVIKVCKADGKIQLVLATFRAVSQPDGSSRIIIRTEPVPPSRHVSSQPKRHFVTKNFRSVVSDTFQALRARWLEEQQQQQAAEAQSESESEAETEAEAGTDARLLQLYAAAVGRHPAPRAATAVGPPQPAHLLGLVALPDQLAPLPGLLAPWDGAGVAEAAAALFAPPTPARLAFLQDLSVNRKARAVAAAERDGLSSEEASEPTYHDRAAWLQPSGTSASSGGSSLSGGTSHGSGKQSKSGQGGGGGGKGSGKRKPAPLKLEPPPSSRQRTRQAQQRGAGPRVGAFRKARSVASTVSSSSLYISTSSSSSSDDEFGLPSTRTSDVGDGHHDQDELDGVMPWTTEGGMMPRLSFEAGAAFECGIACAPSPAPTGDGAPSDPLLGSPPPPPPPPSSPEPLSVEAAAISAPLAAGAAAAAPLSAAAVAAAVAAAPSFPAHIPPVSLSLAGPLPLAPDMALRSMPLPFLFKRPLSSPSSSGAGSDPPEAPQQQHEHEHGQQQQQQQQEEEAVEEDDMPPLPTLGRLGKQYSMASTGRAGDELGRLPHLLEGGMLDRIFSSSSYSPFPSPPRVAREEGQGAGGGGMA